MNTISIPVQLAPSNLHQQILPNWDFNLFSINLGTSTNPELEQDILNEVGSYGKQIGHLSEALEVVIKQLKILDQDLSEKDRDSVMIFLGNVAKVRELKAK